MTAKDLLEQLQSVPPDTIIELFAKRKRTFKAGTKVGITYSRVIEVYTEHSMQRQNRLVLVMGNASNLK